MSMHGMTPSQKAKFLHLGAQLSPENLHEDGEASQSWVQSKLKRINREWKNLEHEIGRTVSHEEVELYAFRGY